MSRAGAVMLPAGRRLSAADLALAAALGVTGLRCGAGCGSRCSRPATKWSNPAPPAAAAIYDANRQLLRGLLEQFGAVVTDLGILRDEPAALRNAIDGRRRS